VEKKSTEILVVVMSEPRVVFTHPGTGVIYLGRRLIPGSGGVEIKWNNKPKKVIVLYCLIIKE